jgi:hypothetical protein
MHRDAKSGQLIGDEIGGPMLLERGFGMGMEIAAPGRHVGMELGDTIDDRHGVTALSCITALERPRASE